MKRHSYFLRNPLLVEHNFHTQGREEKRVDNFAHWTKLIIVFKIKEYLAC